MNVHQLMNRYILFSSCSLGRHRYTYQLLRIKSGERERNSKKRGAKSNREICMIDLKAMLVEREDCDAGTVQQLRNALAQGGNQYRSLKDATELLRKKIETAPPTSVKRWH